MPLTHPAYRDFYPLIAGWIQKTLAEHSSAARPVASMGFICLPNYYDAELLASSTVIPTDETPDTQAISLEAASTGSDHHPVCVALLQTAHRRVRRDELKR